MTKDLKGLLVVETERLRLRRFTADDAPFILRLLNEPSFIKNIADRGVRTVEDAVRYLEEGPIRSYARNGHGLWMVERKDDPVAIGMCGLLRRDAFEDVDLGYAFLPEFWSKGYALESACAVLALGKRALGLSRFIAFVSPGNQGSIRVLEKLGFAPSGRAKLSPETEEAVVYSLGAGKAS